MRRTQNDDSLILAIADEIFEAKDYLPPHPLRV
jgi:hypothetical protein